MWLFSKLKVGEKMKRLIQSIIYDGFNVDGYNDFNYIEIFKNPTQKEIEETLKIDGTINNLTPYKGNGDIRGLLYKDGTVYIWPSDFDHEVIKHKEINLNFNQYHFFTENNNYIRFHANGNEIKYNELMKAIKTSNINDIINLNNCRIEIVGLNNQDYFFEGTFEELNKEIEKVSRLIKSEIYDGFNYKDNYIEVFKNPNIKEIEDTKNNDSHHAIRGVITRDGVKYI